MQLIAESYDLMKHGLGLSDEELAVVYSNWNESEFNAYPIEITSHIFRNVDEQTGKQLLDVILDKAEQKGTGMWTSQDAMDIQAPTPVIDAAVVARNLSAMKSERESASKNLKIRLSRFKGDRDAALTQLKSAMYVSMIITYVSMIITYAQGMAQLRAAYFTYAKGAAANEHPIIAGAERCHGRNGACDDSVDCLGRARCTSVIRLP